MIKLLFIDTPGHGYLRVKVEDFVNSGADRNLISKYSGLNTEYLFLEEDCDAGRFIEYLKLKGTPHTIRDTYRERRNFPTHNYNPMELLDYEL